MSKSGKTACLILLAAVVAFGVVNNLVWLHIDTRPPRWDEAHYLTMGLKFHEALFSGGVGSFVGSVLTLYPANPPLVPALSVPAYLLLGKSADAALAVNFLAFVMLILATYGLGATLASPWCGLLAAVLVSTYPGAFGLSRVFYVDFVNVALVAVSLYLLVRTEAFSRKVPSLAFGVVTGLGFLCRATYPVFVIGPLGISAYLAWSGRKHDDLTSGVERPRLWVNSGLALLGLVVVAAPWYIRNLLPVVRRSLSAGYGAVAVGYGPTNPLTLHAILSYFIILIDVHMTPFGMALFILAVLILWVKRSTILQEAPTQKINLSHGLLFCLSSVCVPLMIFATGRSQDPRFVAPILPAIAVVSAWGLWSLKSSLLKKGLIGSAIMVSLFQLWLGTYGVRALPQEVGIWVGRQLPPILIYRQATSNPHAGSHLLPRRENWPIAEILARIMGRSAVGSSALMTAPPAVLGIIPNHALFNINNFRYYAALDGLPVQVERLGDPQSPEGKDYQTYLAGLDFAVVKTGDPGLEWTNTYNTQMVEFLRSPGSGFVEISPRFPLPDGSQAVLYAANGGRVANDAQRIQLLTPVSFGDVIELLGYDLEEKGRTSRGRAFLVTYYWKALKDVVNDYQVFVHVTEGAGPRGVAGWDHAPVRGRCPTSLWPRGTVMRDQGLYFLPNELSGGQYLMRVGLSLFPAGERLRIAHAAPGIIVDDQETRAAVGTIRLM